jgi:hypothetical protein
MKNRRSESLKAYLNVWHPELWAELDDLTTDVLDDSTPDIQRARNEYATWHTAAIHTGQAKEFYEDTSNDERVNAQQKLGDELSTNPYTLMCSLNRHILAERHHKTLQSDLDTLQEKLDPDTWDEDTQLQQEIVILRDSAEEFEDDENAVSIQLSEQADFLEGEADHWNDFVNELAEQ